MDDLLLTHHGHALLQGVQAQGGGGKFPEGILVLELVQELEGFVEILRQIAGHAGDLQALAGDVAGGESGLGGEGVGADNHIAAHGRQVMEALLHGGGHAGDLDSHVGAASAGEVLDGLLPLLQGGKVGHADHMVGAETLGHLQPLGHAVDDDGGDALLPGNGGGVESHAAGALDQQGLPGYGAEALQAVVDLGEAAVGAGSEVIGKGVGDLVEVLLGEYVVVCGEGARKEGELFRGLSQMDVGVLTLVIAPLFAGGALAAGDVVGGHDAVAGLYRLAGVIGSDALTQDLDAANELMALAALAGTHAHRAAALPVLYVGAADIAAEHPDQYGAGLRVRKGVLHELHPSAFQISDLSVHDSSFQALCMEAFCAACMARVPLYPPSTGRIWAVICPASSETRNKQALAISWATVILLVGVMARKFSSIVGGTWPLLFVRVNPGSTQLAVMP